MVAEVRTRARLRQILWSEDCVVVVEMKALHTFACGQRLWLSKKCRLSPGVLSSGGKIGIAFGEWFDFVRHSGDAESVAEACNWPGVSASGRSGTRCASYQRAVSAAVVSLLWLLAGEYHREMLGYLQRTRRKPRLAFPVRRLDRSGWYL